MKNNFGFFSVTKETFLNKEKQLTSLYYRGDKRDYFLDTFIFGIIHPTKIKYLLYSLIYF